MKTPLPPDPEEQNDSRAADAGQALDLFSKLTGLEDDEPHTQLQDLLCNLMHFADRTEGLDFEEALESARMHYGDETSGEPEGDARTVYAEESDGGFMFFPPGIAEILTGAAPAVEPTPLAQALAALDELLRVTVDNTLSDGVELTGEESDARSKALAVFEKYGPKTSTPALS